ncbi:deoxyuridine 5'-triphosphate nucleotidohydrolase [Candidatus Heimdallarchaeota archaeon B3_Heim]|nr:MAG: deoxyuridine 5'-triphosphate nucleotidohydrolase [Candidatus Heimdallarchaeota archaeon B3_Heim]
MQLKVKKMSKKAQIPTKHNLNDAAFDLYAIDDLTLPTGSTDIVHTGICLEIEAGFFGKIESRSSLAKKGVFCTAGIIDSGYRGEIMIVMNNRGVEDHLIQPGHRVAQLIIHRVVKVQISESKWLDDQSDRGGGFGSSGE